MNKEQLYKIKHFQSLQEECQRETSEYHIKWLLSNNDEEKKILKKKESESFEKMTEINSKIRRVLEDNDTAE